MSLSTSKVYQLQTALLQWYGLNARVFPWRALSDESPNPYHVWLSEIMLQQTTTATVIPYFQSFLQKWPTLEGLAAADLDEVLHAWQGLGYYSRARNLHKCAKLLLAEYSARFPQTESELLKLPGIGPYTAAAISAIAFGQHATVIDGNIKRVLSRMFTIHAPKEQLYADVAKVAAPLTPNDSSGDWAQALMDLGSLVCKPRNPACERCPWSPFCKAYQNSVVEDFPIAAKKAKKPTRRGVVFWVEDPNGHVLLQKRPLKGLLGGMMEFPSTPWEEEPISMKEAAKLAPAPGEALSLPGEVHHTFTHFHLVLRVTRVQTQLSDWSGVWSAPDRFHEYALPTVMKKVARHVMWEGRA